METRPVIEPDPQKAERPSRIATLRLAGAAFVVGAIVTGVFNALHPLPGESVELTLRGILDSGATFWKFDHLMMMLGFWLFAWGFAGIHMAVREGPGAVAIRFGFYGVLMTTAAWTLHAALDGFARFDIAASWDAAVGAQRETWFAIATSMQQVTDGTFPMITVFYWLSLGTIGVGLARAPAFPRWLGHALLLIGAVLVALRAIAIFNGFGPTWDLFFATFATLTTLWALVTGILMLRKARAGAAT